MQSILKEHIRNTYPSVLSLENVREILRISKRKAAWMLHNGYIKCTINEKKTRNYKIEIDDFLDYIDKVEQSNPSVCLPSGIFSSKKTKSHHKELDFVPPCFNQKPPDEFKDWLADEWFDVDELLAIKNVSQLIGYSENTIQRWAHQKKLKTVWYQNHLFTTRDWLIEYLFTDGYLVRRKSEKHIRILLRYFNM